MIDLPAFDALALSLHHAPGTQAILVGSGLSRAAGIPTGWEITIDLIRQLAALSGMTEHDDWPKWYRDKYGKEPNYSEILDALASSQSERRAILHKYIEAAPDEEARKPTKAHHAIAALVASGHVRVVITTNFDRLIENALRDLGIEPTIIASDDAVAGATPLVHAKCTVIKVHGDYLDTRIKNTDAELENYSKPMNALLDQVFDNFGLIAVGWSGEWDTALRSAILRAPSRRYPFYWAAHGELSPLAKDLLEQRGGRSFPIPNADSFFVKLDQTLKALEQANRPHPKSIEMAIALAKRYCRDDQFAMEWAEFLEMEASGIRGFVKGINYMPSAISNEYLTELVGKYMARTEVLRRACLVAGRWGTAEANHAVARTIQSLSFAADAVGGFDVLINLRQLAASLCYMWNLAGLIEREAWDAIATLQATNIQVRDGSLPIAKVLPAQTNSMGWKFLTGLERHHTPISDYLVPHFIKECQDIALDDKRSNSLFDKMEIMIAFGYGIRRLADLSPYANSFWVPFGRFMWQRGGQPLDDELNRIEALPDDNPFVKSGIGGKTKADVVGLINAIRDFRRRIEHNFY